MLSSLPISAQELTQQDLDQIARDIEDTDNRVAKGLSIIIGYGAGYHLIFIELRQRARRGTLATYGMMVGRDPYTGQTSAVPIEAPDDPDNDLAAAAVGLGANGAPVVAGWMFTGQNNAGNMHAFWWTEAGGAVDIGTLSGPGGISLANDISDDGTTVVGESTTTGGTNHAFRYTAALGMTDLGVLPGSTGRSTAFGVNGDGSVVVGSSVVGQARAFRWVLNDPLTGAGTMSSLGTLPGGSYSIAYDVTRSGDIIVGESGLAVGYHPFLWTVGGGMVDLGTPAGFGVGTATSVSEDGAVVVGITNLGGTFDNISRGVKGFTYSNNARAFRWTAATGPVTLNQLMANAGVDMTGITLRQATVVTGDGQFIAGSGIFPDGPAGGGESSYVMRYCDATVAAVCATTDALKPPIGGITTPTSVQSSANAVAAAHHAVGAQLGGTADLLLGLGQPIETPDEIGALAAVGSVTVGANAHWNLDNGFSLNAGAGFVQQTAGGATTSGVLAGASVRYVHAMPSGDTALTPFAEAGIWGSPGLSIQFSRTYANGAGTATGTGDATGSIVGLYAKAGVLFAPTPDDDVVFSATLAHNWLSVGAYAEPLSATNPFPATFAPAVSATSQVKVGIDWTHALTKELDLTLSAAAGTSFGSTATTNATVAGIGSVTGTAGDYAFGQLGARLTYKVSDTIDVEGFVVSTFGSQIGTHTQIGGGLHVRF